MKFFFLAVILFSCFGYVSANTWFYQIKIDSEETSKATVINVGKSGFSAGPFDCEVSPVSVRDETEFRTLLCSLGSGSVSTGALCTKKGHKFPSVQYAILNLYGVKNLVNVVVSCHFD